MPLRFVGSGPSGGDLDWTRRFFAKLAERDKGLLGSMYGWGMHYYCGTAGKGQAVDFTEDDWYELLEKAVQMETLILKNWAAMAETDPEHQVKLIVDEWGAWHRAGTEVDPAYLFGQTSTLRDAPDRRPDPGHLQPARRQGGHGQRGPAHQQPPLALPGP